jgi:isoquinoline 1-oxidoreductase alpha subunit
MIEIEVNGRPIILEIEDDTPLLWVIRENLNLNGTKFGCGISLCGACTVHVDGKPIRSCTTEVGSVRGKKITTIEGLEPSPNSDLHAVQQAWVETNVPQCGYCQSGQIMSAAALISGNSNPTDAEIDTAMSGNICRCGMYNRIRKAIHRAAELSQQSTNKVVQVFDPNEIEVRSV